MKKDNQYEITHIQLFDYAEQRQIDDDGNHEVVYSYSANIIVNDKFVVQVWGNKDECGFDGVVDSNDAFWNSENNQDAAFENVDNEELEKCLEANGFENNIGWLEDNADEVMNPENAPHRLA